MRLIDQPVQVVAVKDKVYSKPRPQSFTWRKGQYRIVEVLDNWTEVGRWWEQQPEAEVWRVRCSDKGVYELAMLDTQPPQWKLMNLFD